MSVLFTADLHLTDRDRDAYRWGVFEQIRKACEEHHITDVVLAGDLTDAKDRHSARLVNRVVDELVSLRSGWTQRIHVLKGNHDFAQPQHPFFAFLDQVRGRDTTQLTPFLHYYREPGTVKVGTQTWMMLPYSTDPVGDWKDLSFDGVGVVALHQPVEGAVGSTGHTLTGAPLRLFRTWPRVPVLAGDVHKPQTVGRVRYVGSPHPVSFGEDHDPQFFLVAGKTVVKCLPVDTIRKHTLTMRRPRPLAQMGVRAGDHVKVRLTLPASKLDQWERYADTVRGDAENVGALLCGLELVRGRELAAVPEKVAPQGAGPETLAAYIEQEGLDDKTASVGRRLLNAIQE